MERYFDAHLYFANWGTHRLMLRVPSARVDQEGLRPYFVGDAARVRVAGEHLILDFHSEDDERDDEDEASLATLAALRTELTRGDLRVAYLAWLFVVQSGDLAEKDLEPPAPPGLSQLTAAQVAMVELLRIDEDLISAAAHGDEQPSDETSEVRKWVLALAPGAKDGDCEKAIKLAIDPRDLASRAGASVEFTASFEATRKRLLRRRGFFDRWKRENAPQRW